MITIACDIDGTLLWAEGQGGLPDTPRYDIINLVQLLQSICDCQLYIWSGSGIDFAERWRDKLGIIAKVVVKGSFVPDIAIDNEEVKLGKVNIKV